MLFSQMRAGGLQSRSVVHVEGGGFGPPPGGGFIEGAGPASTPGEVGGGPPIPGDSMHTFRTSSQTCPFRQLLSEVQVRESVEIEQKPEMQFHPGLQSLFETHDLSAPLELSLLLHAPRTRSGRTRQTSRAGRGRRAM